MSFSSTIQSFPCSTCDSHTSPHYRDLDPSPTDWERALLNTRSEETLSSKTQKIKVIKIFERIYPNGDCTASVEVTDL